MMLILMEEFDKFVMLLAMDFDYHRNTRQKDVAVGHLVKARQSDLFIDRLAGEDF